MNTVSKGSGTVKGSPYISSWLSSMHSPSPSAMGWLRLTTQRRSRSPASRHLSEQGVPINPRKTFEKWPEWRTMRPMPSQTRRRTRSTISSDT